MSHFATVLNQLLEDKELTQAELSRRAGIAQPQISRWINIPNQWIDDEDFKRLCKVFTKANDQANLIRGRLLDMVPPDVLGAKLVQVEVAGEPLPEHKPTPLIPNLPPKIARDIETVISRINQDHLVRDMISSLATHLRRKQ